MTSYPAAAASWMALLPTLVEPPHTSSVSPVGPAFADGCRSPSWSVWNSPQAAVETPSGRTAASSKGIVSGIGAGHPLQHDGVLLETALGRAVAVLVGAHRVPENPVAHPEPGDPATDLDNLARDVGPQHRRVLQPAVGEVARDLDDPVERVDGDGVVADDDLVVPGRGVRRGSYFELGVLGVDPGGGVGRHGTSSSNVGDCTRCNHLSVARDDTKCKHAVTVGRMARWEPNAQGRLQQAAMTLFLSAATPR